MKQGLANLAALAGELTRQQAAKIDYIAPQNSLRMQLTETPTGNLPQLYVPQTNADPVVHGVRPYAHGQFAQRLGVPKNYYDRMMREAPELLVSNVNHWLANETRERRMVRTLDGNVRAFLSDRYQRIENFEIAEIALPVLGDQPDMRIASCEITETRLYIKAIFPRIQGEVRVGDIVQAGVMIRNSEVGAGAVDVTPFCERLVCTNGMVMNDGRLRGFHIGRRADEREEAYILADDTRRADDRAILLKVRDYINAAANDAVFAKRIEKFRETTTRELTGDPAKAIEVLAQKANLNEDERGSVLLHLIRGGDVSQWGVANAVTRAAADVASYDRATELETIGGQVIELNASDWRQIAEAA